MKKTTLSLFLFTLIIGLVFISSQFFITNQNNTTSAALSDAEMAIVDIEDIFIENPSLQMHQEPLLVIQEAAEKTKDEAGYDLIFASEFLLASSDEIVDNVTDKVIEQIEFEEPEMPDEQFEVPEFEEDDFEEPEIED